MDASIDSYINELAARTTIKDYEDIRMISMPDHSTLSKLQQMAVFERAQQRYMATPQYADALLLRLRCITPPLDPEEDREESRILEAQARKELEQEGCPPCYPHHLDILLQDTSDDSQRIIRYWQSFPSTDDVVLCAQLSDWRKFRCSQQRDRIRNRSIPFENLINEIRDRRRRYKLDGDVHLSLDPKQQNRLENWIEFQNYHLKQLERFERKRDELTKECDNAQKDAKEDIEAIRQALEYLEWKIEMHKVFLGWIEEERQKMGHPIQEDDGDRYATPKKPKAPEPEPVVHDSNALSQNSSIKILMTKTPRRKRDTALCESGTNRVSKRCRCAGAGTTSLQTRSRTRWPRLQSSPENVTTRSGRTSRPPVRWTLQ